MFETLDRKKLSKKKSNYDKSENSCIIVIIYLPTNYKILKETEFCIFVVQFKEIVIYCIEVLTLNTTSLYSLKRANLRKCPFFYIQLQLLLLLYILS